ncbi:MAG: translation elongation factor Ts [Bacilli bacterium]
MVSDLRATTGAGLMDCKKALVEAQGNEEAAIEILRKKGVATAAKKAGRTAAQGLVAAYIHSNNKVGVLIEVACESDFVAKNEDFKAFVKTFACT